MKDKTVVMLVGSVCDPEVDEKFNRWYNEQDIPFVLNATGILNARRGKILDPRKWKYPPYVAIYEWESEEAVRAYDSGPGLVDFRKDLANRWGEPGVARFGDTLIKGGFLLPWRVQYRTIGYWEKKRRSPDTQDKTVVMLVGSVCDPEVDDKFNRWYNEQDIPFVLNAPGILSARRGKILDPRKWKYPPYVAIYEWESEDAVRAYDNGPGLVEFRKDLANRWGDPGVARFGDTLMKGGFLLPWRVQYRTIGYWEKKRD